MKWDFMNLPSELSKINYFWDFFSNQPFDHLVLVKTKK